MEACCPTSHLKKLPYISAILDRIEKRFNLKTGLVRIFKLPAGSKLPRHRDGSVSDLYSGKVCRLHIPIITSPGVQFIIGNKSFYLEPGKLYFTNVSLPHFVINDSSVDRIHLIIDVHANDEIRTFIQESPEPDYVSWTK